MTQTCLIFLAPMIWENFDVNVVEYVTGIPLRGQSLGKCAVIMDPPAEVLRRFPDSHARKSTPSIYLPFASEDIQDKAVESLDINTASLLCALQSIPLERSLIGRKSYLEQISCIDKAEIQNPHYFLPGLISYDIVWFIYMPADSSCLSLARNSIQLSVEASHNGTGVERKQCVCSWILSKLGQNVYSWGLQSV